MNITVSNSTIIHSLVQKTEGENFSISENFSVAEKILNWIMKLCSPESKAYNAANVSDETIESMEVKLFTQLIMNAEVNQNQELVEPIDFKIAGHDYQIYQRGDKLYCKNISRGIVSPMKDLTIEKLKTAFFDDHIKTSTKKIQETSAQLELTATDTHNTSGQTQETIKQVDITALDLTAVNTSERRFKNLIISRAQLKKVIEDGGDLTRATIKEGERLDDISRNGINRNSLPGGISEDEIQSSYIDKTMALQLIKAGADSSSVMIAYVRTLVMNGEFNVDLSGFEITPEYAGRMIDGEPFSTGITFTSQAPTHKVEEQ